MSSRSILKVPEPPPVVVKAKVGPVDQDRKSTRLNSSHDQISYAVFCLKKKKKHDDAQIDASSTCRTSNNVPSCRCQASCRQISTAATCSISIGPCVITIVSDRRSNAR